MDLGLAGGRYLVVGGTGGMGLAAALAIADEGGHVVVAGRDPARADAARAAIRAAGGEAEAVTGDVAAEGGAHRVVSEAIDRLGALDGLVVTTGVIGHEPIDIPDGRWVEVFRDVVLGTTRAVEAALPALIASHGAIVTTAAYSIRAPEIARLPYTSMKSAVATFTKGVARAFGRQGVRANCVAPGAIETEAMVAIRERAAAEHGWPYDEALERLMTEEWELDVALGRPGCPSEVGALMAFLLSPVAGYLTGALINIDGGTAF